jgi:hypothetical protein
MSVENPLEIVSPVLDEGEQPVGLHGGRAARLFVVVEHRIHDRAFFGFRVGDHVLNRKCAGFEKSGNFGF